mmetsp:Transcript_15648/g.19850  ORF Transcript_15648/g.19850 Transcript_15648/m.19850 type:complete len:214 (-) Transcript_15648:219-860(-)
MSRQSSSNVSILDRPLTRGRSDHVSLSAFSLLYSELVQYHQNRVSSISELERRLESSGYDVGFKVLELLAFRSRETKRETRIMSILQFISTSVWKHLFGKGADSLERSIDNADEYMIFDNNPITSTFLSSHQISADAYISGIIAGICEGAGFTARVTAHSLAADEGDGGTGSTVGGRGAMESGFSLPRRKDKAVFLVKFSEKVLERDAALANR